jgi:hypothetical protein
VLLSEKMRRQLGTGEPVGQEITPLHPIALVKGGKFIGKRRRRQLGQTQPISIVERETATLSRAAVKGLAIAQRAFAIEMSYEVALQHAGDRSVNA